MSDQKAFSVRLPKELWFFLKKESLVKEKPMNEIIIRAIKKMKKKSEKHLTPINTKV